MRHMASAHSPTFWSMSIDLDLHGLYLWNATDISAAGNVIVGWAIYAAK